MNSTSMIIKCDYQLPTQLRALLGAEYIHVLAQSLNLHLGESISASTLFPLRLKPQYHYFDQREDILIELHARGEDTFAGDLYGADAIFPTSDTVKQTDKLYLSRVSVFGPLTKIVGLGQVRDEVVSVEGREEEIKWFLPPNASLPDSIVIKIQTLEVMGFEMQSGKWLYIFPRGEGHFSLAFNEAMSPEELCRHPDYLAMEKRLQILDVFET